MDVTIDSTIEYSCISHLAIGIQAAHLVENVPDNLRKRQFDGWGKSIPAFEGFGGHGNHERLGFGGKNDPRVGEQAGNAEVVSERIGSRGGGLDFVASPCSGFPPG